MARQARRTSEYMHIIVRGIGKQILFEEESDMATYLGYLKKYADETKVSVLAYCLMENHAHLLVRDCEGNISALMQKTGVGYAQYYNRKYERVGYLFQGRYKSEIITDEVYLLSAFRYILNNPEKAGICRADEYRWSSYREYGAGNSFTDYEILKKRIGDKNALKAFLGQADDVEHIEAEPRKKDDKWALETLKKVLKVESGTALQQFDKNRRDEALAKLKKQGISVRQLERLTGINRGIIQKAK